MMRKITVHKPGAVRLTSFAMPLYGATCGGPGCGQPGDLVTCQEF
ncbi:MAG: hypothetical protein V9G19_04085 [Tetrasphaera sp.]